MAKGPNYVSPSGHKQTQWWCECDCPAHNVILVRRSNLTSHNTKSCGCQNQASRKKSILKAVEANKLDITNQIFGELVAIRPTEQRRSNSVVWECLCSCGRTHYAATNELRAGRVTHCGHNKDSKGVRAIKKVLNDNNIPYITEKTFLDCKFPDSNVVARFDFYINNSFLLEYDGEQHFRECDRNFFKDSLEKRQEHDRIKNEYCKSHNIPLVRIPYTKLNNISLETIMGDTYLI